MIKLASWLMILTCVICFLYSFNQIFFHHHPRCPATTAASNISSLGNLEKTLTFGYDDLVLPDDNSNNMRLKGQEEEEEPTQLNHIVFGIAASSNLWDRRKEYLKQWWRPNQTRGVVWLDKPVRTDPQENLPDIHISGDTSKLRYTNSAGSRAALRISRVVSETLKLRMKDVRWFVMGDDDTIFIADNVVRVLSKYDHRQFNIGSTSESHFQNIIFTYAMAYGGGGFAISHPLAQELAKMQDRCIQRYPALYGSDDRIQACMAELGIPLTKEIGFHQVYEDSRVGLRERSPLVLFILF